MRSTVQSPRREARPDGGRSLRTVRFQVARRLLRENFWFIPLTMMIMAGVLAFGFLRLDAWLGPRAFDIPVLAWIHLGGHAGGRTLLAALAGAIITVAGVVFSVTMAVLTLTTSQFGPRLLRHFVRDRSIQVVLGTFLATFVYTLVISFALGADEQLPRFSVLAAAGLTLASVVVFVYFVHHVATHVQADHVVAAAAKELERVIEGVHGAPSPPAPHDERPPPPSDARAVAAEREGYVTSVDLPRLVECAAEHDVVLHVARPPGAFVRRGDPLVLVSTREELPPELRRAVARGFFVGAARTTEQDVEFALEQLVEVAVRALSPGLNDPFTAVRCVDRLAAGLSAMACRCAPPAALRDASGAPRVVVQWLALPEAIHRAFGPVTEAGGRHASVLEALACAIAGLVASVSTPEALVALAGELDAVEHASSSLPPPVRSALAAPLRRAAQAIGARASTA